MTLRDLGAQTNFIKTTESILDANPTINNGNLYFTTDTRKLFVDLGDIRHCFNSIWYGANFSALRSMPKVAEVLYCAKDTGTIYRYVGNTLTEFITAETASSLSIQTINSLSEVMAPDSKHIYALYSPTAIDAVDGSQGYELYTYLGGKFIRVNPSKTAIGDIAEEKIGNTLDSLETELATIRDSLRADTLDESGYYTNIENFYKNVYTKNQTYTKDEVDTKITATSRDKHVVSSSISSTSGSIVLENQSFYYKYSMTLGTNVNIDSSHLVTNNGDVIEFELLVVEASATRKPIFNPAPTWVDGIQPTYYNNTIIGFKSYDRGINWIAYYQGGWD